MRRLERVGEKMKEEDDKADRGEEGCGGVFMKFIKRMNEK
ncbi:MAG: hypothetical protein AEth_00367 [Candidatus Argoarchaeum ethanivorans]|uniref:Uncharacterized protein n=1 Tax=Candidatus Argoarchaeum ethanivorans TaxID=2608793 RepID=A0A8B3S436_9EURY|nr:MAG: hypothetical protein AEth_00367 [Candidatus Argoarchaeum ethanivorans]